MAKAKSFRVEVKCVFPEWWRYNVFITAVCFDDQGHIVDYVSLADKVYELSTDDESRTVPVDWDTARPLVLQTPLCERADVYVYAVANTFPSSAAIAASPPFEIEIVTSIAGNDEAVSTPYPVNQWGGASIKQSLT